MTLTTKRFLLLSAVLIALIDALAIVILLGLNPINFLIVYPLIAVLVISIGALFGIGAKAISIKLSLSRKHPLNYILLVVAAFSAACMPVWLVTKMH